MRGKWIRGTACLCCLLLLSGCVRPETTEIPAAQTLPPAETVYRAPDGDEPLVQGAERTLYLPAENELHLAASQVWVEADSLTGTAEQLTRIQLEAQSKLLESRLGENRRLTLYGSNPLECSGGICTVNLGTSALQLNSGEFYKLCIALATTLCDLDEISFVNILIRQIPDSLDLLRGDSTFTSSLLFRNLEVLKWSVRYSYKAFIWFVVESLCFTVKMS